MTHVEQQQQRRDSHAERNAWRGTALQTSSAFRTSTATSHVPWRPTGARTSSQCRTCRQTGLSASGLLRPRRAHAWPTQKHFSRRNAFAARKECVARRQRALVLQKREREDHLSLSRLVCCARRGESVCVVCVYVYM